MESEAKKRPASVTVIGWIFIAVAILMVFSGAWGFMAFTWMKQMNEDFPSMQEIPSGFFRVHRAIFQNFGLLASIQMLLGVFVVVAGVQFLKLQRWARTALEVVSWLALVYVVGFGIFFIFAWISMTSSTPVAEATAGPPPYFGVFGAVIGIVVTAFYALPVVVIIKFLRGETIKEAVA